jgi:tRNA threonylcarbamoyladenosine biosynthesis protein TsaE
VPAVELTLPEMLQWARAFAGSLEAPTVIALRGDLGAGKTTLVQAMLSAIGVRDDVTSPSYALVHEYHSPQGVVHHLDWYRLRDASQLEQLGWDDVLRQEGLVFVEWPERAESALPAYTQELRLEHVSGRPDIRRVRWG